MKLKLSKPTKFEWIALCIFLACVALYVSTFYGVSRGLRWQSVKPGMYREVVADILIPIESRYNITDKKWRYRDCSIKLPPDDTIMLGIRLDPKDGEKMFDIARDVYELKRKSPVLHKSPLSWKYGSVIRKAASTSTLICPARRITRRNATSRSTAS